VRSSGLSPGPESSTETYTYRLNVLSAYSGDLFRGGTHAGPSGGLCAASRLTTISRRGGRLMSVNLIELLSRFVLKISGKP
jgi:hypothetical protein